MSSIEEWKGSAGLLEVPVIAASRIFEKVGDFQKLWPEIQLIKKRMENENHYLVVWKVRYLLA